MGNGDEMAHSLCAREFEGGYVFLLRCEEFLSPLMTEEHSVFMVYWREQGWPNPDSWPNSVCRWAKLCLPNRQTTQSVWHKSSVSMKLRHASCIEVSLLHDYADILRVTSTL
jgi:hypothetical protein